MGRITVEDCITKVKNRFELVIIAAKRAKDIERGAQIAVPRNNDKSTLIALREIAEDAIDINNLRSITKMSLVNDNNVEFNEEETEDQFEKDEFEDDFEDNTESTETAGNINDKAIDESNLDFENKNDY